jgi:exosortase
MMSSAPTPLVHLDSETRPASALSFLPIAMIGILMAVLFGEVLAAMANDWWTDPAWSQGMLLPPLALYLAWIQRGRTLSGPAAVDLRGLLGVGAACLTFLGGKLTSEFFLMRISFVVLLGGLVWTYWGLARLRALGFPLLLLATMVPLPAIVFNSLAAPLQLLASNWAVRIAQVLGISVFRDGNIIQLSGVTLGVAEACSGLSALSALAVGSVVLGYAVCTGWRSRLALMMLSVPLAILVNIVRVTGTAILADYRPEYALGFYHTFSGWLVFVLGFGLLYVMGRALHAALDRKWSAR